MRPWFRVDQCMMMLATRCGESEPTCQLVAIEENNDPVTLVIQIQREGHNQGLIDRVCHFRDQNLV